MGPSLAVILQLKRYVCFRSASQAAGNLKGRSRNLLHRRQYSFGDRTKLARLTNTAVKARKLIASSSATRTPSEGGQALVLLQLSWPSIMPAAVKPHASSSITLILVCCRVVPLVEQAITDNLTLFTASENTNCVADLNVDVTLTHTLQGVDSVASDTAQLCCTAVSWSSTGQSTITILPITTNSLRLYAINYDLQLCPRTACAQ